MKAFLIAGVLLLILAACGPVVTFQEPQPAGVDYLASFPKKFQGKYLASDKGSYLLISQNSIIKVYDFDLKLRSDSLPEAYIVKNDSLLDKRTGKSQKIRIEGDSLVMHVLENDTVFMISDQQVLKKFRGYLFLNTNLDKNSWSVEKLGLSKGILTLAKIITTDEIDNLRQLTDTKSDTSLYNFSLSRKQFRKFLKENGFRNEESFYKVRED